MSYVQHLTSNGISPSATTRDGESSLASSPASSRAYETPLQCNGHISQHLSLDQSTPKTRCARKVLLSGEEDTSDPHVSVPEDKSCRNGVSHGNTTLAREDRLSEAQPDPATVSDPIGASPRDAIIRSTTTVLKAIGEDVERPGLKDTPSRHADAFLYLTSGYSQTLAEIIDGACFPVQSNSCDESNMVIVRDIPIASLCEHHLLPFFGTCAIGYIPRGKVLGLSKLSRIADMFAKRLQMQERLCRQIAQAIDEAVAPSGVGVWIQATHMCMTMRGVTQPGTSTVSTHFIKDMNTSERRREFLQLVNR